MYNEKNMHYDTINYFFDWGKMHISLWYNVLKLFQEPPLTCPRRAFSRKRLQSWVICGHWGVCSMKCLLVSGSSSMLNTIHLESKVYFDKHGKFMIMIILFNSLYFSIMNSTGHPPFLAESFQQLKEKILHKELPPPKVKGIEGWYSILSTVCVI